MICVSIARTSRRLTLAGMINAARMSADLVEVRLDTLDRPADIAELLGAKRTPVMISCRRPQDGGNWKGTEEERLILLRQAMLAGADYVAIEHDVADQVPPHGETKRVICYTNTEETPKDVDAFCDACLAHHPDVVQITCKARTPEEAWPLLQLFKNPTVPLVVVGLGWPGIMLALMGRKYGAAWTTASLERGMEDYPGQPTVRELIDVYRFPEIDSETRWVGVTGLGQWEVLTVALLNAAFSAQDSSKRCLPLPLGDIGAFAKFAERLKLRGVVIGEQDQAALRPMAQELDDGVRFPSWAADEEELESAVDVLVRSEDQRWQGAAIFPRAALVALRASLAKRQKALEGTVVMFLGLTPATVGLARAMKKRGALVIFADRDEETAQKFSRWFGGRHVRPEAVFSTLHDVLILGAPLALGADDDLSDSTMHPGFLKAGMTVMDLTALPYRTPFLTEAAARGCAVVEPMDLLFEYVRRLAYRLRGEPAPRRALKQAIGNLLSDVLISDSDFAIPADSGIAEVPAE